MKEYNNERCKVSDINKILALWNESVPESVIARQKQLASRRLFLGQSVALFGGLAVSQGLYAKTSSAIKDQLDVTVLKQPWLTLSEVQEHLFPRTAALNGIKSKLDFIPGANDVNALSYLQTMLSAPDADEDEREFIIKGVTWLDGIANSLKNHPFIKLDKKDREQVLQKISKSETGETWISTLLRYIFEALLTDPVYGGNPNGIGWQWLEHQPGFPRPPENKKYWLLDEKK